MAGEDTLLRLVLLLCFINAGLQMAGFQTTYFDTTGTQTNMNISRDVTNQGWGIGGIYNTVSYTLNLLFFGGIGGLLYSAGMPIEFTYMFAPAIILIATYSILPFILRTAGGLLKMFGIG